MLNILSQKHFYKCNHLGSFIDKNSRSRMELSHVNINIMIFFPGSVSTQRFITSANVTTIKKMFLP